MAKRDFFLNDLFIAEDYRGRHISKLLLEAAKQHSELNGKKQIWLLTAEDNTIAKNLYAKLSFKQTKFQHYAYTNEGKHFGCAAGNLENY